jgi:hypothetical protein
VISKLANFSKVGESIASNFRKPDYEAASRKSRRNSIGVMAAIGFEIGRNEPRSEVYRLLEPGPVVLVTTVRAGRANHVKGWRLTWQTSCPCRGL